MIPTWDPHLLLQVAIFSYTFSDFITGNGLNLYNSSVRAFLNLIKLLLFILVFIVAFQSFIWWFAIIYGIGSYLLQQVVVGLIANKILPLDFFEENLRRGPLLEGRKKTAYILIFCNDALMILVTAILLIRLLF